MRISDLSSDVCSSDLEYLVFQGGKDTLQKYKPVVFAELLRKWAKPFGYHPNDVLAYFNELGYCCFAVGIKGARLISEVTEDTVETNYVFLHCQAHAALTKALEPSLRLSLLHYRALYVRSKERLVGK